MLKKGMYFSTKNIIADHRKQAWHESMASHSFVTEFSSLNFEASLEVRSVGHFRCTRVMQSKGRAYRSVQEIASKEVNDCLIIMQISGIGEMQQQGNIVSLQPGDLTIIDLMQPCTFTFPGKSIQLSLQIPKSMIHFTSQNIMSKCATSLTKPTSRILGPLIHSTFDQILDKEGYNETISQTILALIHHGWFDQEKVSLTSTSEQLRSVQSYIIEHLDAELSPVTIAEENNISERHLHRIFQSYGISVSRWIKQSRLDRCAADLRNSTMQHITITEIAFNWGFLNLAHFSGAFRDQYGESPKNYRTQANH